MSQLKIEVTETDYQYRLDLVDLLIKAGGVPIVYEMPANFDFNSVHGLAEFKASNESSKNFSASYPEIEAWLHGYKGTFPFYLSLKSQFLSKGMLSEKQIDCVKKAIARDAEAGIKLNGVRTDKNFSLKPGEILLITKGISNNIARQAGYDRGHRVVEVLDVEGESEKAYRVRLRLSARKTSHCGICGLRLENPESVAAGIGPICAGKVGTSYGGGSLEELEKQLSVTTEVTTWIPKSAIKERLAA